MSQRYPKSERIAEIFNHRHLIRSFLLEGFYLTLTSLNHDMGKMIHTTNKNVIRGPGDSAFYKNFQLCVFAPILVLCDERKGWKYVTNNLEANLKHSEAEREMKWNNGRRSGSSTIVKASWILSVSVNAKFC